MNVKKHNKNATADWQRRQGHGAEWRLRLSLGFVCRAWAFIMRAHARKRVKAGESKRVWLSSVCLRISSEILRRNFSIWQLKIPTATPTHASPIPREGRRWQPANAYNENKVYIHIPYYIHILCSLDGRTQTLLALLWRVSICLCLLNENSQWISWSWGMGLLIGSGKMVGSLFSNSIRMAGP